LSTSSALGSDEQRLAELGYAQELKRGWSSFSNFAISFSIISVLAGCFTSYGQAFNNGGPVAISIRWWDLLLGLASGRRRLGLVHRLVQPDRADRRRRLGRLRGS
jgi:hypothetical protein